ncbi:1,2-phenylacetyl-CoA epoxidase subunit PaaD [Halosimplex halophilum]|uniref:1,2-phenylacetyl-CoA epoxidase subunit PaaD n=1 Tax=Halosimplex halophilum TaxID=2559572 RepID=UPI00107F2F40|nr:1,2-phenylacetyl-CoA epoxidase subunit PaaD [Halosimplex halophilum]
MSDPDLDTPDGRAVGGDGTDPGQTACAYTTYRDTKSGGERELPATGADATGVESRVWAALREVEDPEMPVSVVDLGLIYGVTVEDGVAAVEMTLTYTGCPARSMLTDEVERAAASAEGVERADVRLVWSPEWTLDLVTDDGKAALREFGVSV